MLLPASTGSGESDFFFFNDTATTEIYTLSLHDALPIWSNTPEVVLAVLEMLVVREESTFTTRVRDWSPLTASHVRISSTALALSEPPPLAETKLVPARIRSDRLTAVASDGPVFVSVSV